MACDPKQILSDLDVAGQATSTNSIPTWVGGINYTLNSQRVYENNLYVNILEITDMSTTTPDIDVTHWSLVGTGGGSGGGAAFLDVGFLNSQWTANPSDSDQLLLTLTHSLGTTAFDVEFHSTNGGNPIRVNWVNVDNDNIRACINAGGAFTGFARFVSAVTALPVELQIDSMNVENPDLIFGANINATVVGSNVTIDVDDLVVSIPTFGSFSQAQVTNGSDAASGFTVLSYVNTSPNIYTSNSSTLTTTIPGLYEISFSGHFTITTSDLIEVTCPTSSTESDAGIFRGSNGSTISGVTLVNKTGTTATSFRPSFRRDGGAGSVTGTLFHITVKKVV